MNLESKLSTSNTRPIFQLGIYQSPKYLLHPFFNLSFNKQDAKAVITGKARGLLKLYVAKTKFYRKPDYVASRRNFPLILFCFLHIKDNNRDQIIRLYQWRKLCKIKWSCTHCLKDWTMFNFIKVDESWLLCHNHNWFWHFITLRAIISSFFFSRKQKSKLGF